MILPEIALSLRQPWASCILHGKPVENRDWPAGYLQTQLRILARHNGRFLLHAGKGMTTEEIQDWHDFVFSRISLQHLAWMHGVKYTDLPRGGMIGIATCSGWVTEHPSPWFTGPPSHTGALVIDTIEPIPFIPCTGRLGFFRHNLPNGQGV